MPWRDTRSSRLHRLFLEGFSAMDVAEPLVSFDRDADAAKVRLFMIEHNFDLVGIRDQGHVCGYALFSDLKSGPCGNYLKKFTAGDGLIPDTANLVEVVETVAEHDRCFVTILDQVGAIVTSQDLEKPPMRMFLFGMISMTEMLMTEIIRNHYPESSWQTILSEFRLEKANQLRKERASSGEIVALIDCLQFSDKGWILSSHEDLRRALGQTSRKEARRRIKEMETLRNNLPYTQELFPGDWQDIVVTCSRWEATLEGFVGEIPRKQVVVVSSATLQALQVDLETCPGGWWGRVLQYIPELEELEGVPQSPKYHAEGDVAAHTRLAVASCPQGSCAELPWIALLHDIAKPQTTTVHDNGEITAHGHTEKGAELADKILLRLGMEQERRERIVWAIRNHMFYLSWQLKSYDQLTSRQQRYVLHPDFPLLLEFLRIDSLASLGQTSKIQTYEFYLGLWRSLRKENEHES